MNHSPIIAIAPDSFKGAISALGAAEAIRDGFLKVFPNAEYRLLPMADGGEGTVDAWVGATNATVKEVMVSDPLGRPIKAHFGFDDKTKTAVIEMSSASGLPLLAPNERNPLFTSTYGTGELVLAALDLGAKKIIMGIGGSATNDGGAGMLTALGARLFNKDGEVILQGGGALLSLNKIDVSSLDPRLKEVVLEVACDVTNPLCGENGASFVYGKQKGATEDDIPILDEALRHFADVVTTSGCAANSISPEVPGAGAAGGLGFGLLALCNASLKRGVEVIAESIGLYERLKGCDLVITGEGRMDSQTVNGKTPQGVAFYAHKAGVKCIAICGCVGQGYEAVHDVFIDAVIPIAHGFFDPSNPAMGAKERIANAAFETARLLNIR